MAQEDLSGLTFGSLTYVRDVASSGPGSRRAMFICVCGRHHESMVSHVKGGRTHNCGCKKRERAKLMAAAKKRDVPRNTPEYYAWTGMKQRCYNPNSRNYPHYGAAGIVVCARWLEAYENFFSDMGTRPSPKHSLDRVDVRGDYRPENCRWALPVVQANNKKNTVFVSWRGQRHSFREWSLITGLAYQCIKSRWRKGLKGEKLFQPTHL